MSAWLVGSGGGVCLGVSALGGGVCLEVSAQGDVCPGGCMYPSMHWARGVSVPVHAEIHIPLWTDFLTYACENITFPQLRCGR